jgi:multidrug efflux pump subunit AcrA (membrane-fusion protein)
VKVKLAAWPTRSFRGTIERVGVAATLAEKQRVFLARVRLDPADAALSPGMTGQAKVTAGTTVLARVVGRRPARWLWGIAWGFLP